MKYIKNVSTIHFSVFVIVMITDKIEQLEKMPVCVNIYA